MATTCVGALRVAARASGRGRGRGAGRGRSSAGGRGDGAASRRGRRSPDVARAPSTTPAPTIDEGVVARNLDAVGALVRTLVKHTEGADGAGGSSSGGYEGDGFRLVRCMPHLKRREADAAVSAGRVLVNGELVRPSQRVKAGDVVTLDGKVMLWEAYARRVEEEIANDATSSFVYLLYNKPRGVVCTMEPHQRTSLHFALERERARMKKIRIFPVGRLDKDSSGLVLLTNDGRVSDALLDPSRKAEKEYDVDVDRDVSAADVERLAAGVVITTLQQRTMTETTAPTQPCEVRKIGPRTLRFVLKEGRNRQIRKMCEALSYDVTRLHRTRIAELELGDLEIGGLRPLDVDELRVVSDRVRERAKASTQSTQKQSSESRRRKAAIDANPSGWGSKIYKDSHTT